MNEQNILEDWHAKIDNTNGRNDVRVFPPHDHGGVIIYRETICSDYHAPRTDVEACEKAIKIARRFSAAFLDHEKTMQMKDADTNRSNVWSVAAMMVRRVSQKKRHTFYAYVPKMNIKRFNTNTASKI